MKKFYWFMFAFLSVLTCPVGLLQAAEPIPLKMVAPQPQTHPNYLSLSYLAKLLNEKAPGRFNTTVYFGNALGSDPDIMRQVRVGTLQFGSNTTANLAMLSPKFGVFSMPFVFEHLEEAQKVLEGPYGEKMKGLLTPKGVVLLEYIPGEFRQIFNSKRQLNTAEDIKGLKLRVAPSRMDIAAAKTMGATGSPLNWTDVYTGIEQQTIDGILVPEILGHAQRFHEVAKHVTVINCQPFIQTWFVNKRWYDSLPSDLVPIFRDCVRKAKKYQIELTQGMLLETHKKINAEGSYLNVFPEVEKRKLVKDAVAQWKELCSDLPGDVLKDLLAAKAEANRK